MKKEIITCDSSPKAIGPYSQAVRAGQFIFVSGQIPIDPCSGEMIQGDIKRQTQQVLKNIGNILTASGSSLDRVIKTTVYMANILDYSKINEVYGNYFTGSYPARSAVEVSRLPKGAEIEMEVIAIS